ncbi:MAG TPA: hypothetical protein VIG24_02145 [Acidimicrobiia bacterium]
MKEINLVQQIRELGLDECGHFIARRDLSPHHRRMVESRARQILRKAAETGEYPPAEVTPTPWPPKPDAQD